MPQFPLSPLLLRRSNESIHLQRFEHCLAQSSRSVNACGGTWHCCHSTVALESWVGHWAKPLWVRPPGLLLASCLHAGSYLQGGCSGSNSSLQTSITCLSPDITSGVWTVTLLRRADTGDLRRGACQVPSFMASGLISWWSRCCHSACHPTRPSLHHFLPPEASSSHGASAVTLPSRFPHL